MTREEHIEWCKSLARELADLGDYNQALISMMSDLSKHPDTANHAGIQLTVILMMTGKLKSYHEVVSHINGFN